MEQDKVTKVELYDSKERFLGITRVFSFTKVGLLKSKASSVTVKSNDLPTFKKGDTVSFVFVYANGTRHRCVTKVEMARKAEIVALVTDVTELEERRRSFKITTKEKATVYKTKAADAEGFDATILNINLGGVLLFCEEALSVGTEIYLNTLNGALEVRTKILRKQKDINNQFVGYGCQFIDVSAAEEEIIAKYILDCQIAERERRKTLQDIGMT